MTLESNSQISDALIANANTIVNSRKEQRRAEQRKRRAQRGEREQNRAAAQEFLDQDTREFRTKAGLTDTERELQLGSQVSVDIDDADWAFGEDPSYMGGDRRGQDDEQTYSRDEKIKYETLANDFVTDIERLEKNEATKRDAGTVNQQAGMRDALLRLQEGKDRFSPGYDAFGAEGAVMNAVDKRLSEELDPTLRAERERAVVREMVQADNAQGNPFTQARNYLKAEAEAEGYRNRDGGLPRQLADEDIGRIEEIRSLGGATPFASHDAVGNFQVVRAVQPGTFSEAIPLYDKDGNIREYYGAEDGAMVQLGEVNIDSSDQALNAPKSTPGQEFVSRNLPAYGKPGATTFGFPQVGINDELALLGDRVRALKGYGLEGMGDPRSISDFEKIMSGIVGRAGKRGDAFFTRDPETGKQIVVPNPGVDDVLAKLGYSPGDKERLANALYQGQAARVVDVNTDDKRAFYGRYDSPRASSEADINFDSAEMRPDGGLQLQKLGNEKVGRGKKARSAKAGLAAISGEKSQRKMAEGGQMTGTTPNGRSVLLPEAARAIAGAQEARNDAQMPLIAQLANEDSERARFVKGDDRNLTEGQLVAKYGGNRGQQAAEVLRRFNEDEQLRAQAANADDAVARKFRQREASIRAKSGLPVPKNLTAVQPTQQAAVPASIAPDPGVGTGNQTSPGSDAGVGRMVPGMDYGEVWDDGGSGGRKPPTAVAASPAPSGGTNGPMPIEMLQELYNLKSRDVSTPDGPDPYVNRERKRREAGRRVDTRRRANNIVKGTGIGLGALAGVLGIERLTRGEDEQQPQEGLY